MAVDIVVVDDDETVRRLLEHTLETAGYRICVCEDGREAADRLGEDDYEPDLLVLDVMMPRLDGKRLLRMIRQGELDVDPSVPVIMLTGRSQEKDVLDGLESGASDYVPKPFSPAELQARIEKELET